MSSVLPDELNAHVNTRAMNSAPKRDRRRKTDRRRRSYYERSFRSISRTTFRRGDDVAQSRRRDSSRERAGKRRWASDERSAGRCEAGALCRWVESLRERDVLHASRTESICCGVERSTCSFVVRVGGISSLGLSYIRDSSSCSPSDKRLLLCRGRRRAREANGITGGSNRRWARKHETYCP